MKTLSTLLFFITLTTYGQVKGQAKLNPVTVNIDDSFKALQDNLKKYTNSYHLGDTLTSSSIDFFHSPNVIDTIFLKKFKLIDTTMPRFKPEHLDGYNCRFIGKFQYKQFLLILTYSLRTYAGDGNPLLILSVFTDQGVLLDQFKMDLEYIHDPFLQPESRFLISKEFEIMENQVEREFEPKGDKLVLTRTSSKVRKYRINDQGRFIKFE